MKISFLEWTMSCNTGHQHFNGYKPCALSSQKNVIFCDVSVCINFLKRDTCIVHPWFECVTNYLFLLWTCNKYHEKNKEIILYLPFLTYVKPSRKTKWSWNRVNTSRACNTRIRLPGHHGPQVNLPQVLTVTTMHWTDTPWSAIQKKNWSWNKSTLTCFTKLAKCQAFCILETCLPSQEFIAP